MPLPILLLHCGLPPKAISSVHNGYAAWFQRGLGSDRELVHWHVQQDLSQPVLANFSGIVVTGSPASLTEPEPWMEVVVECIREAAETAIPLLGVCFGHQLVGCAFGAATILAPDDGEHGSLAIALTAEGQSDPLFENIPPSFLAQLTHFDMVDPMAVAFSNGLRVLASSEGTPVQALAAGNSIRSVQFHPEFNQEIMRSYLTEEDRDQSAALSCPHASLVFKNWLRFWVDTNN